MVVTSRMLSAHTSGSRVDVKSRFWSNYYRSLKDVKTDGSSTTPRAAGAETFLSRSSTTAPPFAPLPAPSHYTTHTISSTPSGYTHHHTSTTTPTGYSRETTTTSHSYVHRSSHH